MESGTPSSTGSHQQTRGRQVRLQGGSIKVFALHHTVHVTVCGLTCLSAAVQLDMLCAPFNRNGASNEMCSSMLRLVGASGLGKQLLPPRWLCTRAIGFFACRFPVTTIASAWNSCCPEEWRGWCTRVSRFLAVLIAVADSIPFLVALLVLHSPMPVAYTKKWLRSCCRR